MRKALTLIEVLIALAVLVVAFSSIMLVFASCIALNDSSRNRTIATEHARYVMEDIKNTDFNIVKNNGNSLWNWSSSVLVGEGLTVLDSESVVTTVSGTDLLDVVVTVNWQDRGGRAQSIAIETLIAEP